MPALLVIVFVALIDALMPEKVIEVMHISLSVAGAHASVIEAIFIEHLGFTEIGPVKRDSDIRELLAVLVMPCRSRDRIRPIDHSALAPPIRVDRGRASRTTFTRQKPATRTSSRS